jgi:heme/copper-type cytochrome/quinol oxidase subunit 2
MSLRTLIRFASAVALVAAIAFAVLLPSNSEEPQSTLYVVSFWVAAVALLVLVLLLIAAAFRRLVKPHRAFDETEPPTRHPRRPRGVWTGEDDVTRTGNVNQ